METELKLKLIDPSKAAELFEHDWVNGLLMPGSRRQLKMHSLYYDTADGVLNKRMATLRVRLENDSRVMTIKLGEKIAASLHQRLEWNLILNNDTWNPDLEDGFDSQAFLKYAVSDGDPDDELQEILELIDDKPLLPVCEAHFERISWDIGYGDTLMELALDDGYLKGGDLEERMLELELELKEGDVRDLLELGESLQEHLPLEPEHKSKYARCLDLLESAKNSAGKGQY
ncbi:MAG: CYTH domain-containing protein [Clostridiaceae bacterium]|nr:CYTH domain-containing protein [Clostridiaceae bacterium]